MSKLKYLKPKIEVHIITPPLSVLETVSAFSEIGDYGDGGDLGDTTDSTDPNF